MNGGKLDGAAMKRLKEVLVDAFPTWSALDQMATYWLGEPLESIVAKDSVGNAAHALIVWTHARDRIDELLRAALRANPHNQDLTSFAVWFRATPATAPPAAPGNPAVAHVPLKQVAAATSPGPSKRAVRDLLGALVRSDSDLNALSLDFFEDIHGRFTNGMERGAKVDLLLQHAELDRIVAVLREVYKTTFDRHAAAAGIAFEPRAPATLTPAPPAPPTMPSTPLSSPPSTRDVSPPLTDPALFELQQAYADGELILFAGAGVSAAAGLPSWKRLVELLADRARARGAAEAALAEIAELARKERFVDALTAAKLCLGAPEFGAAVEKSLNDAGQEVPEVARAIAALAPRLRAVLTTNVDHLLERAFAGTWPPLAGATGDIAQRRRYILKLHGTLLDRSSWVFTRDEYDRAMYATPKLQTSFSALFHACPILFVGYGLADDDFELVLGRVRALVGDQPPRHFVIAPAAEVAPGRRARLEASGLRIVSYRGGHAEVTRILRWLAETA